MQLLGLDVGKASIARSRSERIGSDLTRFRVRTRFDALGLLNLTLMN